MKLIPFFEDFVVKDDKKLHFDPNAKAAAISTKFGKGKNMSPYVSSSGTDNVKILSVYARVKGSTETPELNKILTSLKGKGPYELDGGSMDAFISRTAVYAASLLKGQNIDLAITIESKSSLCKTLLTKLKEHFSFDVKSIANAVQKNPNTEEIELKDESGKLKVDGKIKSYFDGVVAQAKKNEYFKISDIGLSWLRQYVQNWLKIPDDIKAAIKGKDVLIIDDYMTTGVTMKAAIKLVKLADAKSITAVTILK